MRIKRNYSNVAATVALVVSLAGGTAFAAQSLITSPGQLGRGVVTNAKVRKQTLEASRLTPIARTKLAGAIGPAGPPGAAGPQGPAGPAGDAGPPGATDVVIRERSFQIASGASATGRVECNAGERAVGGGLGLTSGIPSQFRVWSSRPVNVAGETQAGTTPTGWVGSAVNSDPDPPAYSARVWVVCAAP